MKKSKFISMLHEAQDSEPTSSSSASTGSTHKPRKSWKTARRVPSAYGLETGDYCSSSTSTTTRRFLVVNGSCPDIQTTGDACASHQETDRNYAAFPELFENKLEIVNPARNTIAEIRKWVTIPRMIQGVFSSIILSCLGYKIIAPFLGVDFMNAVITLLVIGIVAVYFFHTSVNKSTRSVKWHLVDFSNDLIFEQDNKFLTSPVLHDKSGEWRIVIRLLKMEHSIRTAFGLLAVDIPTAIDHIYVNLKFSVTTPAGRDIGPSWQEASISNIFGCEGDCAYTEPIEISDDELLACSHKILIKCKVEFMYIGFSYRECLQAFLNNRNARRLRNNSQSLCKKRKKIAEVWQIEQERNYYEVEFSQHEAEFDGMTKFIQNPNTKSAFWKIPKFSSYCQESVDAWGIHSPQIFIFSNGFCTIWRLRLLEIHGIFHLEFNLRGLPRGIDKIKSWFLIELMDEFGDFITSDSTGTCVKYPSYLQLWSTTHLPLFRRQKCFDRFIQPNESVIFRLSFYTESTCLDCDWLKDDIMCKPILI